MHCKTKILRHSGSGYVECWLSEEQPWLTGWCWLWWLVLVCVSHRCCTVVQSYMSQSPYQLVLSGWLVVVPTYTLHYLSILCVLYSLTKPGIKAKYLSNRFIIIYRRGFSSIQNFIFASGLKDSCRNKILEETWFKPELCKNRTGMRMRSLV